MFTKLNYKGYCRLIYPYSEVICRKDYLCDYCELAFDIRSNKRNKVDSDESLFTWRDALKTTPKGGGACWYYRPVILKPESMREKNITVNLINQIFFAYGGSGVLVSNPAGMVDGFLVCDPMKKEYTFTRHDFYGVPNDSAVQRYYDLFGILLNNKERKW